QPYEPQLVIATDIDRPPGVTMWRNGARASTRRRSAASAADSAVANPRNNTAPGARYCGNSIPASGSNRSPLISRGIVEDDAERLALPRRTRLTPCRILTR